MGEIVQSSLQKSEDRNILVLYSNEVSLSETVSVKLCSSTFVLVRESSLMV